MKKLYLSCFAALLLNNAAMARDTTTITYSDAGNYSTNRSDNYRASRPYIGLSYQLSDINYNGINDNYFEDNLHLPQIFGGVDFDNHFAAEIGYSISFREKNNSSILGDTTKSRLQIFNLDGLFRHPVSDSTRFLLIASVNRLNFDTKGAGVDNASEGGYAAGFGAGVEKMITNNISLRASAKILKTIDFDKFDDMYLYNVGLKYGF